MITAFWGILAVVIGFVVWALLDFSSAKTFAVSLMLQAERLAEELVLETGKAKMDWVVSKTYPLLPKWVRLFVSQEIWRAILQRLYDQAVEWVTHNQTAMTV
ncbi:MAG: hypothetical protein AB1331_06075 [Bacillota bacterium]